MFAKKELSVYIEREKKKKKSINEFVKATDLIINFYLDHFIEKYKIKKIHRYIYIYK